MDHLLEFVRYAEWLKDGKDRIEWIKSTFSSVSPEDGHKQTEVLRFGSRFGTKIRDVEISIYFPICKRDPSTPHGCYDVFCNKNRVKTFDPTNPNALNDAKAFCENWYRKWKLTQILGEELK